MDAQTFITPDLIDYIKKYRSDEEMVLSEQNMIADAMCGIEITVSGMHVDERTIGLLKTAMSVISTYHWVLELMRREK